MSWIIDQKEKTIALGLNWTDLDTMIMEGRQVNKNMQQLDSWSTWSAHVLKFQASRKHHELYRNRGLRLLRVHKAPGQMKTRVYPLSCLCPAPFAPSFEFRHKNCTNLFYNHGRISPQDTVWNNPLLPSVQYTLKLSRWPPD